MTLFKALKILLKLGEKETIVLGFKSWHASDVADTIRYLDKQADRWCNHSIAVWGRDEVRRSVNKSNAYDFISKYLVQGKQIWVKQATYDYFNAYAAPARAFIRRT